MQDNIQLTHNDHLRLDKKFPLSIIASDLTSPLNVGSLFRLCDALGIERLYLCGDTPAPPNSKVSKTSRSTEKYVDFEIHEHAETLVRSLQDSDSYIISLEITSSSIAIGSDKFKSLITDDKPVCLILGSENSGVNETLLALSDATIHIPMIGNNSSMNVITAASIACFEISRNLL
jgi:tRNA G18 (ribose-2'-O)-methylase SpoU